jgi:outer membrane protein TolC
MPAQRLLVTAALLGLSGCIPDHPRPLEAAATGAALESRTLSDSRLAAFIEATVPGAQRWDLTSLTLAALYYHPSLDVARGELADAHAARIQAGQRPDPSLRFEEISRTTGGPVAWTITPIIDFLIQTGGKRAAGIRAAQARIDAARAALLSQSWRVRAGVREALLSLWEAQQRLALHRDERQIDEQLVTLLEHRLAAGETSALDVALVRSRLDQARLAEVAARDRIGTARAQLAAGIGVPLSALDGAGITLAAFDTPATPAVLEEGSLRRAALTGRSDVQELLAQYQVAQAALSLAIAGQYPDLILGPGYSFDTAHNRYFFAPELNLPLHGNRGAIAMARAQRETAAARFTALQAQIIAALDAVFVEYRAAVNERTVADALLTQADERERRTIRSFEAGALDRPALLAGQLERNAVAQSQLDARVRERQALGALEDALQQPFLGPALPSPQETPPREAAGS